MTKSIRIEDAIELACEPRAATSFAFDVANDVLWRDGVRIMRAAGPVEPGTRTYEELRFLGSTYVTHGEITERDDTRFAFRGQNAASRVEGHRLALPHGTGTRFSYSLRIDTEGFLALLAPLLRLLYARRVRRDLRRLRAILDPSNAAG